MTLSNPGIQTRPSSPCFRLIGEREGQVIVDLHLGEVALNDRQAEDFGEELG